MSAARLALLFDFPQERWPSMDLVAEQLLLSLQQDYSDRFDTRRVCPHFFHAATRLLGRRSAANNVDRLFNRFLNYPRYARKISRDYDFFHVCDHSYSQLVHSLPADRTGVFCHDLDTFRSLLDPVAEPRSRWFRAMAARILRGMENARIVFHSTAEVRRQILHYKLVDPSRLVHAPYGVAAEFTETSAGEDPLNHAQRALVAEGPFLLHVGSCIPRKRIDVLLDTFALVRKVRPSLRLIKIGGEMTPAQRQQIDRLGIAKDVFMFSQQTRSAVAAFYRHSAAVLMPSEAEGFGLPIAEALACGAIVIASDIPVLREVGGDAILYAPLADVSAWAEKVQEILDDPSNAPAASLRRARAARFTWKQHAQTISDSYRSIT